MYQARRIYHSLGETRETRLGFIERIFHFFLRNADDDDDDDYVEDEYDVLAGDERVRELKRKKGERKRAKVTVLRSSQQFPLLCATSVTVPPADSLLTRYCFPADFFFSFFCVTSTSVISLQSVSLASQK